MNHSKKKSSSVLIVLLLILSACNLPGNATEPAVTPPPTELVTAVDTATSSPPTEPPIQHQVIPVSLPENRSSHAGDYNSSLTAKEKKSNGGDRFTFEKFERPFNSNTMDIYFPELDIIDTLVHQDDLWIYGTIQVVDRSAVNVSPYRFAMQLDVDVDGKGDFLVLALNPPTTDWTTNGVEVYEDRNNDVGNQTAMFSDEGAPGGDGFETNLFNQGKGDDPDAAWIRVSLENSNIVEIAVKRALLGNPFLYLVDMWAGHGSLDPAMFDFSDHYTHDQAGAADPGLPNFYPIKSIFEIDNTCRMAVGFQPKGGEPGLCPLRGPIGPGDPPAPGCQLNDAVCASYGPGYYFSPMDCACYYLG